jgi:hypothetical protein
MSQKETDQTSGSQAQKATQVIPDESLLPVSQIKPFPAPVGVALWFGVHSSQLKSDREAQCRMDRPVET